MEGGWNDYKYFKIPDIECKQDWIMIRYDYEIDKRKIKEYLSKDNLTIINQWQRYKQYGLPYNKGWAELPEYILVILELLDQEYRKRDGQRNDPN